MALFLGNYLYKSKEVRTQDQLPIGYDQTHRERSCFINDLFFLQ